MADYDYVPYRVRWEDEDAVFKAVRDGATNEVEIHQRTGLSCNTIDRALSYLRDVLAISGGSDTLTANPCRCSACS
jgi:hypothetical protein